MKQAVNKPGVLVPQMGISYPDDPSERLVHVEQEDSEKGRYHFDDTYPYLDTSFEYKLNQFGGFFVKWLLVNPFVNRLFLGLKIEGRKNLKKNKKALAGGMVAVCNHVFFSDALIANRAVLPYQRIHIPMFAKHFNGSMSWFLRAMGGVPIPESPSGVRGFNEAFDTFHKRGESILVFPEAVRWNWYQPIRPFRKGAFTMAWRFGAPVVPLVITFRERKGLYRLFGPKKTPCLTVHVGEPIIINKDNPRKVEVERLREEAHRQMVSMAGILENPWPTVPEDEKINP